MTTSFAQWWSGNIAQGVDHRTVIQNVCEDAGWSSHFGFMTLMSAGIAILGLLLSSPAVVIGAMLISPLMGPIIGLGFSLATFDSRELRRSASAVLLGIVVAVLFCALIVAMSPLQSVTGEISARTRPNLFDLLVALFSGLAGTYAMIRGRHGAIVGVAIATAVMPPLAVMGFGLATRNWPVFGGSTLLFFTNLMTIAAAAAVLARIYGFAPNLSPRQTRFQAALIGITLVTLAVPLAISLRQIAWEALAGRKANETIVSLFPRGSRVNDLTIDYHARPIEVSATVFTPQYRETGDVLANRLSSVIGQDIVVTIDQIRTESAPSAGLRAALAASRAQRSAARLAERLALVAGIPIDNVVMDRASKRAIVRAAPLPGANLATYRILEGRIAADAKDWTVNLIPPLAPFPAVSFDEEDVADQDAIDTAVWAARRRGLSVGVVGGGDEEAEQVAERIREAGAEARILPSEGRPGRVELRWSLPGSDTE